MSIPHHPLIDRWYQEELATAHHEREDAGVVMGFPLWGEAYVQRFLDYMLPSMMAEPNRLALDRARGELVLYVDRQSYVALEHALPFMPVFVRLLPDELAGLLHHSPEWKYSLMSAVHNLLIHQAARKGAGFGMAVADIVYSDRYFERLLALGQVHDVIVHQALIVSQARAAVDLDSMRRWQGEALALPADVLGNIGWRHVSGLMKSWNMNDIADPREGVPGTHFVLWRGKDSIRMHCPHLTPVWLSNKACHEVPTDIDDTLDARFVGSAYMPTLGDDMALVTIDNSRDAPADRVSFDLFRHNLLAHFAACMPQFKVPCMVPTLPATDGFLPDGVIERRFQELCGLLGV